MSVFLAYVYLRRPYAHYNRSKKRNAPRAQQPELMLADDEMDWDR